MTRRRSSRRWAPTTLVLAASVVLAVTTARAGGIARAADQPVNDSHFQAQWNLDAIGAPAAWSTARGQGVTIGIVDSGIDSTHPDLRGKVDAQADCLGGTCTEGPAPDGEGHGTAVAGVAAADTGNSTGIAGVAPAARLVIAKAIDDDGVGDTASINAGIRWVVDHGARVVNLSLGSEIDIVSRSETPLTPAIEYAWSRGAIPVLASGNSNRGLLGQGSANYGNLNAVVVGATDATGKVAWYSSSLGNAKWGIVAPGGVGEGDGAVLSTDLGGTYTRFQGTSLSAPHVSGALALLLGQGLDASEAVDGLLAAVDPAGNCGDGCRGSLRADRAVAANTSQPSTVTTAMAAAGDRGSSAGGGSGATIAIFAVAILIVAVGAGGAFLLRRRRS